MAQPLAAEATQQVQGGTGAAFGLMLALYFGIGFITAMNDVLVPHFKDLFHLTNVRALLVQFCFFGAYFLLALPSGAIVARIGYKRGIVLSLATIGCGLLLFLPASLLISYPIFLLGLFVVGCGLSLLQVAINPYVGALGAPERAASRLNLCGFCNSLAGTLAPRVGALFIFVAAGASAAQLAHSVRAPYAVLAALAFALALLAALMRLPVLLPERDRTQPGAAQGGGAWRYPHLRFGMGAIFCYVGAEVALGSLMISYLGQPSMGGMSHALAARYLSLYWGGAMVARLVGFFVLKQVGAAQALAVVAAAGVLAMATAVFGHGPAALWAVVGCGVCNSVMWPCIFPLGIQGLGRLTSQASGLMVMMVVGGAVVPLVQGWVADHHGYAPSFTVILLCYAYVLFFALRGHRVVQPQGAVTPAVL